MRKGAIPIVTVEPTQQEYCQAALLFSRRTGEIPSPWLVGSIVAVLVYCSTCCFWWNTEFAVQTVSAVFFALLAVTVAGICLIVLPRRVRQRAQEEYRTYKALRLPMKMLFGEDVLQTESPVLCTDDSYARIKELIETPQLLVFRKDDIAFTVLPKRCFDPLTREESLRYLRTEFSRHHRVMRNWIF